MAGEDREYVRKVHWLPCMARELGGCDGPIQAHHASEQGMARKSHDHQCASLCRSHHLYQWHERKGSFAGWSKDQRAEWEREAVARTQELVARLEDGMELFL